MKAETIISKTIVMGELVLDAPLLVGAGAGGSDEQDIHIVRDSEGKPFLPGTSLAGALRAFMKDENPLMADLLFGTEGTGSSKGGLPALQSSLSISDIRLEGRTVIRDGVAIDVITHTATDQAKYNYEAIDSSSRGLFSMLITLRGIHEDYRNSVEKNIKRLIKYLMSGISVGAHTAKGLGRIHVERMTEDTYDFRKPEDVLAWLSVPGKEVFANGHAPAPGHRVLQGTPGTVFDKKDFVIVADFSLRNSLIVRDYDKKACADAEKTWKPKNDEKGSINAVMKKNSAGDPILPGTSLKGVMRQRAYHILRVLEKPEIMAEQLMGLSPETMRANAKENRFKKFKSPFFVEEARFTNVHDYPQARNRIDRFTSGVISTSLFTTLPIWHGDSNASSVRLTFGVHHPEKWQIGLTLLLLKDLWLGRVAIGGEKSIGRGTLAGLSASIHYEDKDYTIRDGQPLRLETAAALQEYVDALLLEDGTAAAKEVFA